MINPDYEKALKRLPDYMVGGVRRYIEEGIRPGDFLCAVFENNLHEAFARADDINRSFMWEYANLLHQAPIPCWGSKKKMQDWIDHQGLKDEASEELREKIHEVLGEEDDDEEEA